MDSIDPTKPYKIKAQVYSLQSTPFNSGVANNVAVVNAATGKRIRVMGWIAQSSTGVVGVITLKSASAGTALMAPLALPPITGGLNDKLPITDTGYFETNTGEGLFCDIVTAAVALTIFYITYIP